MLWHEYKVFLYIFWRARVCWPLLCLCAHFCVFGRCMDSNPESCRSKHVRYQLNHPSPSSYGQTLPRVWYLFPAGHDFQLTTDRNLVHKTRQHCLWGRCEGAGCLCNIGGALCNHLSKLAYHPHTIHWSDSLMAVSNTYMRAVHRSPSQLHPVVCTHV